MDQRCWDYFSAFLGLSSWTTSVAIAPIGSRMMSTHEGPEQRRVHTESTVGSRLWMMDMESRMSRCMRTATM